MSTRSREKTTIGRAEKVVFPELEKLKLHARIDTGARTSSLDVASCEETEDGLVVVFNNPEGEGQTPITKVFPHYQRVIVASSMGHQQVRFKVRLSIVLRRRRIRATFTLADRSSQVYPVLIGRSALNRKFVVDVAMGSPLRDAEEKRSEELQSLIVSEEKI